MSKNLENEMLCSILKNTEQILAKFEAEKDIEISSLKKRIGVLEKQVSEFEQILINHARDLGKILAKIELSEKDIANLKSKKSIF